MRDLIIQAALAAPSADNSQPWKLNFDGDYLNVMARRGDEEPFFALDSHANLLSLAALEENISQIIGSQDRVFEWVNDVKKSGIYFSGSVPKNRLIASLDHALFARMTNRFPFRREVCPQTLIDKVETFRNGDASVRCFFKPVDFARLINITHTSSQVRFDNYAVFKWFLDSLRFGNEALLGDGLDVLTLPLDPGAKSFLKLLRRWDCIDFLNKLGLYRLLARAEATALKNASAVLCIVGRRDQNGIIEAGRLMQRLWISLTQEGWSVQPFYVVADQENRLNDGQLPRQSYWQPRLATALDDLYDMLQIPKLEMRLHMMLRIGRPTIVPPRSKRLNPSLLVDDSAR